jgi:tRNA-Thr(GGU) m(6)t(6)A37 methyltransferase TsaA
MVENESKMAEYFRIFPVGIIIKNDIFVEIRIDEKYKNALLGLGDFSHIIVCYWLHKNDTDKKRSVLQVHPRNNRNNPKRGVFATHSPLRPNLIAISICKILSINECTICIEDIDAFNGTPVIDIKGFMPYHIKASDIRAPTWLKSRAASGV